MSAPSNPGASVSSVAFGNVPLARLGIIPIIETVAPASTNTQSQSGQLVPGQRWIDTATNASYTLTSLSSSQGAVTATWVLDGSSSSTLDELLPDSGTSPVLPTSGAITIAGSGSQILTTGGTNTLTFSLIGPYTPTTYTSHGVLVGAGTSSIAALSVGTNGQVLLGSSGANPAFGTLTSSTGISFTTGAGSLAINVSGGGLIAHTLSGSIATSNTQNSYILTDTTTTITLPTTAALGDFVVYAGTGANTGGFSVVTNISQNVISNGHVASSSVTSSSAGTALILMCIVANTDWVTISQIGSFTYT